MPCKYFVAVHCRYIEEVESMAQEYTIKGRRVSIHSNGQIFVDGRDTKIKQWSSSATRYSNLSGQEQKDISGKKLEDALMLRGFLPR